MEVWETDGVDNYSARPLQMHIHTPSEHTIDGKQYDAELHFVHEFKTSD